MNALGNSAKTVNTNHSWTFFLLAIVFGFLACMCTTASAATFYLDASTGNDSNPGTSEAPWKTIAKAQASTQGGDTVYVRTGEYGAFIDASARDSLLTYRAEPGHHPELDFIQLGDFANRGASVCLAFNGFTIAGGDSENRAVTLYEVNQVQLSNCTLIGQGYQADDSSAGISIHHCTDVVIQNCMIKAQTDTVEGAYRKGIYGRYSHDVTVQDCEISRVAQGISAWGERWTIAHNDIHHCDSDGIVLQGVCDSTIRDNHIHEVYAPIHYSYSGPCTYTDSTAVIRAVGASPFPEGLKHYIRFTRSNQQPSLWYTIQSNTSDAITLSERVGTGDYTDIVFLEIKHGYHCDGIQCYHATAAESETVDIRNIRILRNKVHAIEHQGLFFRRPDSQPNMSDLVFESNLVYDVGGTIVDIFKTDGVVFRNNTIVEGITLFRETVRSITLSSNILYRVSILSGATVSFEDYNILYTWWTGMAPDFSPGSHDIEYANDARFRALFASFDEEDFRLVASADAVDRCPLDETAGDDMLGNPPVDLPGLQNDVTAYADAGCYEYHGPVMADIGDVSVEQDKSTSLSVTATDPDGNSIIYSADGTPFNLGATFSGQTFSWDTSGVAPGAYEVTFVASDGEEYDSQTVTITVLGDNQAPVLGAIGDKSWVRC